MEKDSKIYVAGHKGLVGSGIVRRLQAGGFRNILVRTSAELDLSRQADVERFFEAQRPEYVFVAAAKVGGIMANNTLRAEFIYQNLAIELNLIHCAWQFGAKKLLFLGSSCIYPQLAPQPMKEEYLLTGPLEPTNKPYAVAKIAGIEMVESYNRQYGTDFISAMPTNLYGPGDNFDLEGSHVLPALIRKFHEAKLEMQAGRPSPVVLWGTGSPYREFLHVDDLSDAVVFLMENYSGNEFINIGAGREATIREMALMIKEIVGYEGEVVWDSTKPDGMPRKLLDSSRLKALGWEPKISLRQGLTMTYEWYLKNKTSKETAS